MKTRSTLLLNLLFLLAASFSARAERMPVVNVPQNVVATATSTTEITLTWADPSGGTVPAEYEIQTATDEGFASPNPVTPNPTFGTNSKVIPGLTANTLYYIRIRAKNGADLSAYVSVQATTFPGPPTLNAPTNVTNNSASLTWSAPAGTGTITNYELQTNGGAYVAIGTAQPYVASLSGNTAYTFTLRAVNGGTSAPSASVGTTTLPNQPGTIGFSDIQNNSITLTWAAGAGGANSYLLQVDGGAAIPVTSPYVASGLSSNTVHTFSLVAFNGPNGTGGASTPRTDSQITRPDAPTGLGASLPSVNSLSLAFTAPGGSGTLTNYELSTNGGPGTLINQTSSPYPVGNLSANTAYSFTLKAQNAAGLSAESVASTSVTTRPNPPSGLMESNVNTAGMQLDWTAAVGGADSYTLAISGAGTGTGTLPPLGNVTTTNVTTLSPNVNYTFTLTATNASGASSAIQLTRATRPNAPGAPTVGTIEPNTVALSWSAPSGDALSGYSLSTDGGTTFNNIGTPSQPYTVGGLNPNTSYTFVVKALNTQGLESAASGSATATTRPNAPGTIIFSDVTTSTITLTWAAPSGGAASYQLQIDGAAAIPVTSPYPASGLSSNTLHTFSLVAFNGPNGTGGASTATTGSQITRPIAPATLAASAPATNSVTLNWTPPTGAGPLMEYLLSTNSGPDVSIGLPSLPYIHGGLTSNTPYTFSLKAKNAAGESLASNSVSTATLPDAPGNFMVTAGSINTTDLALTWTAPTGTQPLTGYQLDRATDAGFTQNLIPIPVAGTPQTVPVAGLSSNTRSYFRLRATNATGASAYAITNALTKPDAPTTLTTSNVDNNSALLTWTAPGGSGPLLGYQLSTDGGTTFGATQAISSPYPVTGLAPNTAYTFVLRAENATGLSVASAPAAQITTLPNAPGTIIFSDVTTSTITLTWAAPSGGAASYQLQIDGAAAIPVTSPYPASGLSSNTLHTFSLVAFNGPNGTGGASTATTGSQITRPIAPATLAASAPATNSVTLNWTPPTGAGPLMEYLLSTNSGPDVSIGLPSLPYIHGGLTSNTPYTFSLKAKNAAGESLASNSVSTATLPDAPGNFMVTAGSINTTDLALTWTAPTGTQPLTGYQLDRATDAGFTQNLIPIPVAGTPQTVPVAGLSSNTRSYFRLRATNATGASAYAITNALTKPDAPTTLTTSNVDNNSALLTWTAPGGSGPLLGYQLSTDGGTTFGATQAISSPYPVTGLAPNTAYTFVLRAENATGLSVASAPAAQITTRPNTPSGLTATATDETSITLGWTAPLNGAISYRVDVSGAGTGTGPVPSLTTSVVVSNLSPNVKYTFVLTAINSTGDSDPSPSYLRATLPRSATLPTTTNITNNTLTLGWTPPSGDALTGYSLLISTPGSGTGTGPFSVSPGNSYPVTNLSANTEYTFALTSQNASGNSTPPLTITTTTRSAAPTGLIATATDETSITLGWDAPTGGATSYSVAVTGNGTGTGTFPSTTTSLVVGGLSPNVKYTFVLTAINSAGNSDPSQPYQRATLPLSATLPTITNKATTSLTLGWMPPSGDALTGYSLLISTPGSGNGTGTFPVSPGNSYPVTNLSPNTPYSFALTSQNASGNSTLALSTTATTLPRPITALTASNITTTTLTLGWTAPADGAASYQIVVSSPVSGAGGTGSFPSLTTSLPVANLTPNTPYTFQVTALNADSGASTPVEISLPTRPDPPTGLSALPIGATSLTLNWTPPSGTALTKYVLVITNAGATTDPIDVPVGTTFVVNDLTPNTTYTFELTSENASGQSTTAASTPAPVTTLPNPPTGLIATLVNTNNIKLGWAAPALGGSPRYKLVISGGAGAGSVDLDSVTTYTAPGLDPNTTYTFKLTAVNGTGASAEATLTKSTKPNAPGTPTAVTTGTTSVALNWATVSGNALANYTLTINGGTPTNIGIPTLPYSASGLMPNTSYTFVVKAVNVDGLESDASGPLTVVTKPDSPGKPVPSNPTTSSITLTWTAPPSGGAAGYRLTIAGAGTGTGTTGTGGLPALGNVLTTTVSGLSPNVNYTFTLVALNSEGVASAPAEPLVQPTKPGPPTTVQALPGATSATAVQLSWTAPPGDALSGYSLVITGSGNGTGTFDVPLGSVYTANNLTPNTQYTFSLTAVNLSGSSTAVLVNPVTRPGTPTNLRVTVASIDTTSIPITWAPPAGGTVPLGSYEIQYSTDGTNFTTVPSPPTGLASSFTVSGLSSNTLYTIRIRAQNSTGYGEYVTTTGTTAPKAPSNLQVPPATITANSVVLTWTPPSGTELIRYELYYNSNGSSLNTNVDKNLTTYLLAPNPPLTPNTEYTFLLFSRNITRASVGYAETKATTLPAPPTNFQASNVLQTTMTVQWVAPTPGTVLGYELQYSANSTFASGVTTYTPTGLSQDIANLNPYTPYYFRLRARNITGYSAYITLSQATKPNPPVAPTDVQVPLALITQNKATVTWTGSPGPLLNYVIEFSNSASFSPLSGSVSPDSASRTFDILSLSSGTTYYFRMKAVNTGGTSANSATVSATTLPNPPLGPTGLQVTDSRQTTISLSWTAPVSGDQNSYELRYSTNPDFLQDVFIRILSTTGTTYTATDLLPNTTYYFRLYARNSGGTSADFTAATGATKPYSPAVPTGLTAANVKQTTLTLNWTAPTGPLTGYALSYSTSAAFTDSTVVPAPAVGDNSKPVTGLTANTTYYFRLRAVNTGGSSPNATATVTTAPNAPTAPGPLTATNVEVTTLTLNWTAPTGNTQTGYRLVRSTSAAFTDSTTLTPPAVGVTSLPLTGLTGNTTYYFRLYALNLGGSSAPATTSALTKPAPPTLLAAPAATLTQTGLTLTWTPPAGGPTSTLTNYELQYATSADFTAGLVTTTPANTATSELISGLSPNVLYYFRLRAQNATGFSTYATLQTTTLPGAPLTPTIFAASAITISSLTLTWTAPTGPITGYQLDRATDAGFTQNLVPLTPAAGASSQAVGGLSGGTRYFFRLRAINAGGNSPYATTDTTTLLAAPTGFAVVAGSIKQTELTLNWVAPTGTVTGYELQQATDAGFTQNLVTLTPAAGALSQAISGLSGNTLYYFRLRAQNGGSFSAYASTQATTPPAAPTAPADFKVTPGSITTSALTLTWIAPAGPIIRYQLDRATDAGFTQNLVSLTPTAGATSQAVSGLSGGTQYFFRLLAVNAGGNSSYATLDATTLVAPPATPTGFQVVAQSLKQTSLTLGWNNPTGTVTGYDLQQATDAGFTQNVVTLNPGAGATSQLVENLSGGTTYYFRLRSQNAGVFSGYANVQATTLPSAPGVPGNFAASNVAQTSLTVSWASPGGPVTRYELQYSTDQNFGSGVTTSNPTSTSQSVSGLSSGTTYYFRLRAENAGGFSGYASTQATTQQAPPAAPTQFSASATSSSQINLTWSNPGTQSALELQYATNSSFSTNLQNIAVGGSATSASVTGLTTTTTYYFRLRAQNGGGFSNYANAQATTLLDAPGAPSGLTATALSTTQIRLQWTDNASNEQGYYVEVSVNGGNFNQITTLSANTTTYTATGLTEATNYTYRIRSYNSAGTSAASNTASATTPLGLPAAPTTLVARATGQTTIALTWLDVATNESGYEVERSLDGTTFTPLAQVGANANSYTASGLTAATSYWFRVRATNATGPSAYSNVATIKSLPNPPLAPSDLLAIPATQTSVQLNWKDNSANETGFEVERSSDSLNFTAVATVPAGSIQAQVTGLTANTRYYFRVRAVNEGGNSAYTATVGTTTLPIVPNGPANLVASDTTQSTVKLTWKDNATDETGYEILQAEGLSATLVRVSLLPANTTTTVLSGLKVDQVYRFVVRSVNTGGSSTPSNEISLRTLPFLPLAPTNVQTKVLTQTAIRVLWDNPAGAITKLEVEQSLDGKTFSVGKVLPGTAVATEFSGLPSNTIFYFRLRAFNRAGIGAYSVMVKDTTLPTMPAAPTNLTTENVRARQLRLRWKDNADSEANFEVELFRNGRFERIATPAANSDTVTVTGLTDLTDYRFRVRSINRAGASAYTGEATARTTLGPPDGLTNLTLNANPSLVTQVKLRWTIPNVRILDSVEVERSTDGVNFSVVQRLAGRIDSSTVTSLDPSQRYVFRVRGKNQVGFSPYSNLVERPVVATGVEDPALAAVRLRPNPVDDELVIETENDQIFLRAVEGYHLSGQRAFRFEFDGRDSTRYLSLGHLPHGLYLLRIETSAGMTQRKMLKN